MEGEAVGGEIKLIHEWALFFFHTYILKSGSGMSFGSSEAGTKSWARTEGRLAGEREVVHFHKYCSR